MEEVALKIKKAKSTMSDTFPWQHGVFKSCQGRNAVLVVNCHRNFQNMKSGSFFL